MGDQFEHISESVICSTCSSSPCDFCFSITCYLSISFYVQQTYKSCVNFNHAFGQYIFQLHMCAYMILNHSPCSISFDHAHPTVSLFWSYLYESMSCHCFDYIHIHEWVWCLCFDHRMYMNQFAAAVLITCMCMNDFNAQNFDHTQLYLSSLYPCIWVCYVHFCDHTGVYLYDPTSIVSIRSTYIWVLLPNVLIRPLYIHMTPLFHCFDHIYIHVWSLCSLSWSCSYGNVTYCLTSDRTYVPIYV